MKKSFKLSPFAIAMTLALPAYSMADEAADARLQQLEKMMQQMQQQRAEQDRQLEALNKELQAVQEQLA
jgi:phosphate-selective porin OprO/OprP